MGNFDVYQAARERMIDLVKNADTSLPVPTCPGWTVKDVVAHCSANLGTFIDNDPKEMRSPTRADEQVEARREQSLDDAFAEWDANMNRAGELFDTTLGAVAASDVLAHEQDIRTAIDQPGRRGEEGVVPAVEMALAFVEQKIAAAELPAFRVITEDLDKTLGEGEPAATLRTSTYELFRSLHGRRSPAQVRALEWDGDPDAWMDVFFLFGPAENDVKE
jgi:uncharacterized protein (TIGR03083 family)